MMKSIDFRYKRILAALTALIVLLLPFTVSRAESPEEAPPLPEITGFGDIGETRVLLLDVDTGEVVFQINGDVPARPGSLTTIMTALLLIENTPAEGWDEPIPELKSVNSSWSGRGSQMGLKKGDTPTRRDLLYGLMLVGAADAAFVTGNLVSGSEMAFVSLMNTRAAELGMKNTNFQNTFGMGSGGHYSSAYDLGLLITAAMKLPVFRDAAAAASYICSEGAGGIRLENTNPALGDSGFIGIRSGADSDKEHSLAVGNMAGQLRLCAIVLEAPSDREALSFAERLIAAGISVYSAEGGLYPSSPTDAVFYALRDTELVSVSGAKEQIQKGESLRVCGSSVGDEGEPVYLVYRNGAFYRMKAYDASFVRYVDDVFIENGASLSMETRAGSGVEIESFVTSRHRILSCTIDISLITGDTVFSGSIEPNSHGKIDLSFSKLTEAVSALNMKEGLYVCTVTVKAEAKAYGRESAIIEKSNRSVLTVDSGGECVSYNANTGDGAPLGECFFDFFRIGIEIPTKPGYAFVGWNTKPDGSDTSYAPGDTVDAYYSLTLYATWEKAAHAFVSDIVAEYDKGLVLTGSVKNPAGITKLMLAITDRSGNGIAERSADCLMEEAEPSLLLLEEPLLLEEGEYIVTLFASSDGAPEKIFETKLKIGAEEAQDTPEPSAVATVRPVEPMPEKTSFSLLSVPIFVWFLIGAAVVAGLIVLIIVIIKRG